MNVSNDGTLSNAVGSKPTIEPLRATLCCTCAFTLAGVDALAGETGDLATVRLMKLSRTVESTCELFFVPFSFVLAAFTDGLKPFVEIVISGED
ncbi:hypothetical protein KTT_14010 [Tengunoibacter tsumagoiensis]|uniref:Uncharacterized protein n=1 Tax=Tengunoibacter tsumagoiensis TaxID=2014871 RepID=A0A401ZXH0_9CHLR|nr:hypothetical protein KTT_14010 [Tengunoibacter tsumagoiensis]